MPGSSSNSSFIPKRGTSKRSNKARSTKLLSFTVVAYVLLFAALVASAVVFFFQQSALQQLEGEVNVFNDAVSLFETADLLRVQEFDLRLQQANHRVENSASVVAVLEAIEDVTIRTVTFNNLDLVRNFDDNFVLDISIDTDTFDSSIFQRDIYSGSAAIDAIEVTDVSIVQTGDGLAGATNESLTLNAQLAVPVSAVPYTGEVFATQSAPIPVVQTDESLEESADETAGTETDEDVNNETAI